MAALAVESAAPAPPSDDGRPRQGWVATLVPSFVALAWDQPKMHASGLPLPDICRPFFREGEEGEKQYRLAVGAAIGGVRGLGRRLAELAERHGAASDAFGRCVLLVLPKDRCTYCTRPYISTTGADFCSDGCRRRADREGAPARTRQVRAWLRRDCARCGKPIPRAGLLFCNHQCFRAAEREHLSVTERRTTCLRCDAPLGPRQVRYCGRECQQQYTREWLDGLVTL